MRKKIKVAVLGATGAVGREMCLALEESSLDIAALMPIASEKSAGKTISFKGKDMAVQPLKKGIFEGFDYVLGAVSSDIARLVAPEIVSSGAIFIDNSSCFRLCNGVPLIVPQINPQDTFNHRGIVSNPNCVTIIVLTALAALEREAGINSITVSTYQAVSGAGAAGIDALKTQMLQEVPTACPPFQYPIAANLIPHIGSFDQSGFTAEELKLKNEGRKILHRQEDLKVSCTCVRVPVFRSHSASVQISTKRKLSAREVKEIISNAPGCVLVDDIYKNRYPMPIEASGQNKVLVGRVREDDAVNNGISLWCCGDQLRRGAAVNAVEILELLANEKRQA